MNTTATLTTTQPLYSVEQVAERLGLHVRTVRAYVRDGRLKATRIGKQYRIAHADLEALLGRAVPATQPEPRHRHVDFSSIVQVDAISPDQAMRIANGLIGMANAAPRAGVCIDTSYDEARARLKIILTGEFGAGTEMLRALGTYLET